MVNISLTKGKFAIIDAEDYDYLSQFKWQCSTKGYAMRQLPRPSKSISLMHREILNAPPGLEVDHINGNPLDNRKCNLRLCTKTQNLRNRRKSEGTRFKYKGVRKSRWSETRLEAHISFQGKTIYLGTFDNEIDAAKAYDKAALIYYGEFACLNFPEKEEWK